MEINRMSQRVVFTLTSMRNVWGPAENRILCKFWHDRTPSCARASVCFAFLGRVSRNVRNANRGSRTLCENTIFGFFPYRGCQRRRDGRHLIAQVVRPRTTKGISHTHRNQGLGKSGDDRHQHPDCDHPGRKRQQNAAGIQRDIRLQLHGEYPVVLVDRTRTCYCHRVSPS